MIEIELKNGKTGYDAVGEYIHRYWKHYGVNDTVIVSIGTSYDGRIYEHRNEVASPYYSYGDDIEFLYDWWEGEKFIRLFGIISLDGINISGGIYTEDQ